MISFQFFLFGSWAFEIRPQFHKKFLFAVHANVIDPFAGIDHFIKNHFVKIQRVDKNYLLHHFAEIVH